MRASIGGLVMDGSGIGQPIPELRRRPGGHLEQDNRRRVPFGGRIVPATGRLIQERIQVRRRARGHRRGARAGQGEVEQHQMLGPVAAALADAKVGGLDVPVVDSGAVERDQGLQQVGAPAFQKVQRQALPAAEHLAERLVPRGLQDQGVPAADIDGTLDEPDQPRVVQAGEHLGLVGQPPGGRVVDRHLEDAGGVRPGVADGEVGDQQADRGGAGAEAALQAEPARDDRAGGRLQRIGHVVRRAGQRPLGVGQPFQERPHVRQPVADRRTGGVQHHRPDGLRDLRQVRRQVQAPLPEQPLAEGSPVGGGRTARQHEVGQGTEREHV